MGLAGFSLNYKGQLHRKNTGPAWAYIAAGATVKILLFFARLKLQENSGLIRLRFLSNGVSHLAVLLKTPENSQHEICFCIRFVHLWFYSLSSSTNCYAN